MIQSFDNAFEGSQKGVNYFGKLEKLKIYNWLQKGNYQGTNHERIRYDLY